jgi:hypothetical protein
MHKQRIEYWTWGAQVRLKENGVSNTMQLSCKYITNVENTLTK